jgi:hypothetical protein
MSAFQAAGFAVDSRQRRKTLSGWQHPFNEHVLLKNHLLAAFGSEAHEKRGVHSPASRPM